MGGGHGTKMLGWSWAPMGRSGLFGGFCHEAYMETGAVVGAIEKAVCVTIEGKIFRHSGQMKQGMRPRQIGPHKPDSPGRVPRASDLASWKAAPPTQAHRGVFHSKRETPRRALGCPVSFLAACLLVAITPGFRGWGETGRDCDGFWGLRVFWTCCKT